jgi:hypothetical protein
VFDTHAQAWQPFLIARYGAGFTEAVLATARAEHEALIPTLPYIGGDGNEMTRHLIRCTTSLALYKAMKARGKTAQETGKVIYDAVADQVSRLPRLPAEPLTHAEIETKRAQAQQSHERRYPEDWVWDFVEGDGIAFDYGYDFYECTTFRLYQVHGADEFLPYYCFLDFVTVLRTGWGFTRTMTLGEGYDHCDFRFKLGGGTDSAWPPPFLRTGGDDRVATRNQEAD